jgi:3-phenylpropionate/trans-cinnamate dioxygenase ferredoxin component
MSALMPLSELADGSVSAVDVDGVNVALIRIGDDVYALANRCSHANVELSDGEVRVDEMVLECPKHGSAFSVLDGSPDSLPATRPVAVYGASVIDGVVHVHVEPTSDGHGAAMSENRSGAVVQRRLATIMNTAQP